MLNNTTWTAQDVKDKLITHFDEPVDDASIRLAVNFFYALVGRAKREFRRSEGVGLATNVSVPGTGYDLTGITDLGSLSGGFQVFNGTIKEYNELKMIQPESTDRGFYIIGTTLFLSQESSGTIGIKYQKKTARIESSESLSDHTLKIDQDLEETVFRFCLSVFYEGEFQAAEADRQKEKFWAEVQQFFSEPVKTRTIRGY